MKKILITPEKLIFVFVCIAVVGSLYIGFFGDPIRNLQTMELFNSDYAIPPCDLCWYQRMGIYPIAIISLIGLILKEKRIAYYILPFSIITVLIATYHVILQETGTGIIPCGLGRPCDVKEFEYLGFITIPVLSLFTSLVITILGLVSIKLYKKSTK